MQAKIWLSSHTHLKVQMYLYMWLVVKKQWSPLFIIISHQTLFHNEDLFKSFNPLFKIRSRLTRGETPLSSALRHPDSTSFPHLDLDSLYLLTDLCKLPQAGWEVTSSGLSADVPQGLSMGFGWNTQGQTKTWSHSRLSICFRSVFCSKVNCLIDQYRVAISQVMSSAWCLRYVRLVQFMTLLSRPMNAILQTETVFSLKYKGLVI